jgi:hypothetical protein
MVILLIIVLLVIFGGGGAITSATEGTITAMVAVGSASFY